MGVWLLYPPLLSLPERQPGESPWVGQVSLLVSSAEVLQLFPADNPDAKHSIKAPSLISLCISEVFCISSCLKQGKDLCLQYLYPPGLMGVCQCSPTGFLPGSGRIPQTSNCSVPHSPSLSRELPWKLQPVWPLPLPSGPTLFSWIVREASPPAQAQTGRQLPSSSALPCGALHHNGTLSPWIRSEEHTSELQSR